MVELRRIVIVLHNHMGFLLQLDLTRHPFPWLTHCAQCFFHPRGQNTRSPSKQVIHKGVSGVTR